jgi:hypothetical protein
MLWKQDIITKAMLMAKCTREDISERCKNLAHLLNPVLSHFNESKTSLIPQSLRV